MTYVRVGLFIIATIGIMAKTDLALFPAMAWAWVGLLGFVFIEQVTA